MTPASKKKPEPATELAVEPVPDVDPFDPAFLRVAPDYETVGVKREITMLPTRKPSKQDYVMVHPSKDYREMMPLLELKEEREFYLVHPAMRAELEAETVLVHLYLAIARSGALFLWPIRLPGRDGKQNPWHESAEKAAQLGMRRWVRLIPDAGAGMYNTWKGSEALPGPDWPELPPMKNLLRLAFADRFIDTADHPVVRRLRGLA
jgi:hypothetical protein